ncbi:MAG TPA: ABC transporter, partial [Janthinobacterium sp.]|nr:ABC transporter [Janthinobacterium sp.]
APLPALVVADVSGPAWLDSERMYYRLLYADVQQARPYARNRWNTAPLQLLSQRLKSRIAQSGVKVLGLTDAAASVMLLRVDVDDFSQNFDTPASSSAQVTLRASVFGGHRLIDQKTFSRKVAAASADAPGGARALAEASDAVAADIIAWLATLPRP